MVDFVNRWADKTGITVACFVLWLGIATSKVHHWRKRYGKANEHSAWGPRDHWLTEAERQAIVAFHRGHPLEGYRRLTFLMLDRDVVACSPASVYRALKAAGLPGRHRGQPSTKGQGLVPPARPHEHGHVDVSYLNVAGTFSYLCSVLDGYSRYIAHGAIRPAMTEADVEAVVQRARERFPGVTPRVITDNGRPFLARDFKEFLRIAGMAHGTTAPYYPQSNGKSERSHRTRKGDCLRTQTPLSLEAAQRVVARYVEHYNTLRLHSAPGYVTPPAKLQGRAQALWAERDRKLEAARQRRALLRPQARQANLEAPAAEATT